MPVAVFLLAAVSVSAQENTKEELKNKIQQRSQRIEEVEKKIDKYQTKLQNTKQEKNTLQSTLNSLDKSVNQLQSRMQRTQNNIDNTRDRIQELSTKIKAAQSDLSKTHESLAATIRALRISNDKSLMETVLSAQGVAEIWKRADQLNQIQSGLQDRVDTIQKLQKRLQKQKQKAQAQKEELEQLQSQLASQKEVIASQRERKRELLAQTNRREDKYQQLLAKKQRQKERFKQQLRSFENQLESQVSDASIPSAGEVRFSWPVQPVRITQQFGGTEFSKRNPQAYGRSFHNGTDFGVPVGTPVNPVAGGTVRDTGNTDQFRGCQSYGKWVLVDHGNGLSTLYAHLSAINTSAGAGISSDQILGYSGNTGYSTGPHLHLTAYATGDVRIQQLGNVKTDTNCGPAPIPVAPTESYLNPMKYLPQQ